MLNAGTGHISFKSFTFFLIFYKIKRIFAKRSYEKSVIY